MTSASTPPSRIVRVIRFPLTRIITALFLLLVAQNAALWLATPLGDAFPTLPHFVVFALPAILAVHVVYVLFVHGIEQRTVTELSPVRAGRELGAGMLLGVVFIATIVLLLWLPGYFRVTGVNPISAASLAFSLALYAGYVEEVMLRGVVFRMTEEWLGSWVALLVSSLLFGFGHLANPEATIWSSVAIALEAGILLGAAYMVTRRLWMAIGIHFAWNFTLGGVFGLTVSGLELDGILAGRLEGPSLLTGGNFGIEASVLTVIIAMLISIVLLRIAWQRGHVIPFRVSRRETQPDAHAGPDPDGEQAGGE